MCDLCLSVVMHITTCVWKTDGSFLKSALSFHSESKLRPSGVFTAILCSQIKSHSFSSTNLFLAMKCYTHIRKNVLWNECNWSHSDWGIHRLLSDAWIIMNIPRHPSAFVCTCCGSLTTRWQDHTQQRPELAQQVKVNAKVNGKGACCQA